jgi:hypothetical protein
LVCSQSLAIAMAIIAALPQNTGSLHAMKAGGCAQETTSEHVSIYEDGE